MDAASEPTNLDFKVALTFIFTSRKWPRKLAVAIACVSLFWFPLVALTLLLLAQSMAMGHSAAHLASRTGIVLLVLGLLSSVPGVLLFGYAIETARVVRSGAAELPFWRPLRSKLVDGALLGLVLVIW